MDIFMGVSSTLAAKMLVPLGLSLKVAGVATAEAVVCGVCAAYLVSRYRFAGREILDAILTLPLVLPPTVIGYYLLVLIGRKGWIGAWLYKSFGISLVFTWQGAVLAAALVATPLIFKSARAAFEDVDSKLEDAARTLGLNELSVFIRVSLPLAWRGILAGSMLAFARAMGEFGATLIVAGNLPGRTQTLSLAVYEAVQAGNDHLAALLVLLTSLTCMFVLLLSGRLLKAGFVKESRR
jgi:molybdate transport system permease protein